MSKIKHPTEEFFHKIQKELKKKAKQTEIIKKFASFGVTKYILVKFYLEKKNLDYIKRRDQRGNKEDLLEAEEEREKVKTSEQKVKKELFLKAIIKTMGNISEACKQTGMERKVFYAWLASEDEEFKTEYYDTIEREVDFVETKLIQEINDGNTTAIIFYLKTKGKKRGYIETQDLTMKSETTATTQIIIEGVDPDKVPE